MATKRSSNSRLLAIGVAVLVVGVLLVLVILRNAGGDGEVQPSPVATSGQQQEEPTEEPTPLTAEQIASRRLQLPLEVPEGTEAMAMKISYVRSVAGIPTPGDRVSVYRYLPVEPAADGEDGETAGSTTTIPAARSLPEPGPESEQVVADVEVLAVTGPLPASNDGTLTMVLAVPTSQVSSMMPLADDQQLWFTLLPSPDEASATTTSDDPTESSTDGSEEPA